MAFLKILTSCWLLLSIVHLVLFYYFPHPHHHYLWDIFIQSGLYLNLCVTLLFMWMSCKGIPSSLSHSSCPSLLISYSLSVVYIWAVIGACCVVFYSSQITNVLSLFWGTSLFFAGISLTLAIYSLALGFSAIGSHSFTHIKPRQFFILFLVVVSVALNAFIFLSYPDSLSESNSIFMRWSFIASSLLLIFQVLLTMQEYSHYVDIGLVRLKRMLHSLSHFLIFEGPLLFAFFLYSHPHLFHSHSTLSALFLLQIAITSPLLLITYFYSSFLDSQSFFPFYS